MELINQEERRAVNAILFFVTDRSMRHLFKTKMFKLLSLLDFIHFNQTGRTVTGETYKTFPRGPVPVDLFNRIRNRTLSRYFKDRLRIIRCAVGDKEGFKFVPIRGAKPDMAVFSKKEIDILKDLVFVYKDATADQMTKATHLKNLPWEKTMREKGLWQEIDIMEALEPESKITEEMARERINIQKAIRNLYRD
jgi:uncharacterized phage-associated protein